MNSFRKTLFISDLHLDESHSGSFNQFKDLINSIDSNVDALYILGDFFEAWIGDDDHTPFYTKVTALLQSVHEKNIPVYFMHGNRDFLVGKKMLSQAHCKLLADPVRITIYGTPVLLMHGDTLCIDDLQYQRARKWMRNGVIKFLFSCMPLSWRRKVANKMRNASRNYTTTKPAYIMDVTQDEVRRVMLENDVKLLIHGHTHKPAFHHFSINGKDHLRIVLGAWHDRASVLVWSEDGSKTLEDLLPYYRHG